MVDATPAGDPIKLSGDHVAATVEQLRRRIDARFGERGLTKAARDLGHLVVLVQTEAGQSHVRLRRTTLAARTTSVAIIAATLIALLYSLRSAVLDGLARTADWVPLTESVINDLVFAAIAVVFLWAFPERQDRGVVRRTQRRRRCAGNGLGHRDADDEPVEQDLAEDLAVAAQLGHLGVAGARHSSQNSRCERKLG